MQTTSTTDTTHSASMQAHNKARLYKTPKSPDTFSNRLPFAGNAVGNAGPSTAAGATAGESLPSAAKGAECSTFSNLMLPSIGNAHQRSNKQLMQ